MGSGSPLLDIDRPRLRRQCPYGLYVPHPDVAGFEALAACVRTPGHAEPHQDEAGRESVEGIQLENKDGQWNALARQGVRPRRFRLAELQAMPTIDTGQADDLKLEAEGFRVWLSRATTEDGATGAHEVCVTRFDAGSGTWVYYRRYRAR